MPLIGITTAKNNKATRYLQSIEKNGGTPQLLTSECGLAIEGLLDSLQGLLLTGGDDIDPFYYGDPPTRHSSPDRERDAFEIPLVQAALKRDMPILGICRGMQVLNVAMGGKLIQDFPHHRTNNRESAFHDIYIAPGSRLAVILKAGVITKVNSRHHQGFKQAQKAPNLLASAYSSRDGIIEAVESTFHRWVMGVQCHPEREDEVPEGFRNLFMALVKTAEHQSKESSLIT
ncbi:MAG: gamma-glutamyl-gamma-aminobutyrate hydrolase family protein [Dehalococcoidia bacterium]